jgi:hypothetical protein
MTEPTPAQLATLAAWWFGGGSNEAAATALNRRPQTVKNQLWAMRREQGARSNVELAQRYAAKLAEMHKGAA